MVLSCGFQLHADEPTIHSSLFSLLFLPCRRAQKELLFRAVCSKADSYGSRNWKTELTWHALRFFVWPRFVHTLASFPIFGGFVEVCRGLVCVGKTLEGGVTAVCGTQQQYRSAPACSVYLVWYPSINVGLAFAKSRLPHLAGSTHCCK